MKLTRLVPWSIALVHVAACGRMGFDTQPTGDELPDAGFAADALADAPGVRARIGPCQAAVPIPDPEIERGRERLQYEPEAAEVDLAGVVH